MQHGQILEITLNKFEEDHNICCAEDGDAFDPSTVTRWLQINLDQFGKASMISQG